MAKKKPSRKKPARGMRRRNRQPGLPATRSGGEPARRPHPTQDELVACLRGESDKFSEVDLRELFGNELEEFRAMAKRAKTRGATRGDRPKVYLLHGIMGSELGTDGLFWDTVYWLGLVSVFGQLKDLRLSGGGNKNITSLGFFPLVYLKMQLHLEHEGFEVVSYHYDWRHNLKKLGEDLKRRIEAESKPVKIVAHSMGGLVTRSAIKQGMKNYSSFIMLAVPNNGSLAPVEAMRGQYELANWIAAADVIHDGLELAEKVFCTFPGLHQMILGTDLHPSLDLHRLTSWPTKGPRPKQELLSLADGTQALLAAPPDAKTTRQPWYLIAGSGVETKVRADVKDDEFEYEISLAGDGTVPLKSAEIPGVPTWYAYGAGHGFFANDELVRKATVDLLRRGTTEVLADKPPVVTRGSRTVNETQLRELAKQRPGATRGDGMSFMAKAAGLLGGGMAGRGGGAGAGGAVPAAPGGGSGYVHRLRHVTVGRRRARRLEVQLYNGSITDVDARAYVLGTFSGVAPTGAAGALDKLMDGALAEIIGGNMFGSRTGEVFILPLARRAVRAETAVFVGLGAYDEFKTLPVPPAHGEKDACGGSLTSQYINDWHVPVLEIAAENAMRTLARTHVEDFATVLLGGTLSQNQAAAGESLLRGLLRGLDAADSKQDMRRVTLCEMNQGRYEAIRDHLFFLAGTPLLAGIEIDINELCLETVTRFVPVTTRGEERVKARPDPIYLTVRALPTEVKGTDLWRFTPLGPSARAALREGETRIARSDLEEIISEVPAGEKRKPAHLDNLNKTLLEKLVPDSIIEELGKPEHVELPVVVLHDASSAARVPWEVLRLSRKDPPLALNPKRGLSRRFIASSSDCMRWSAPSQPGQRINVLIIGDPRDNLPSAKEEARSIATKLSRKTVDKLSAKSLFRVEVLMHSQATKTAVLQRLKSGSFDIIHYSGHAGFDDVTKQSHLKLADGLLEGADLVNIPRLPFLMVLNACQSMRTRSDKKLQNMGRKLGPADAHSIAETLLCSGIGNLIGTFWEVFDDSACDFALELYDRLLGGDPLGAAMRAACVKIADSADWANYELFGDANATLRRI